MTFIGIALLFLALVGFATSSRDDTEGSIWLDVLLLLLVAVGTAGKRRKSDDDEDC